MTIVGAGISGLACAIACALRGRSVTVIEQAEALTEIGAGLQIAPNGGGVLRALGVAVRGIDSEAVHLIDGPSGRSVLRMTVGPGFRMLHRADLIAALAGRARQLGVGILLGTKVAQIERAALRLADGSAIPFARLIGADGVRGAARAFVAPDLAPRFTGQVAWRATVPVGGWRAEAQVRMGPGRHLVWYPLRDVGTLNIVAVEERSDWTAEGWSHTDDPQALQRAFAEFAAPVGDILARVETVHLWGLMDHGVTPRWTRGACTLIGDAAHPTLPFLAQGANLALEDAWTLAASLDDPGAWEAARRPRVARVLAAARGNAGKYHLGGMRRHLAHGALRALARVSPRLPMRGFRWLYDHDVTAGARAAGRDARGL